MSKIPNFEMFNFEKQRPVSDAECPQEFNGAICFCFVRGIDPPPIAAPQASVLPLDHPGHYSFTKIIAMSLQCLFSNVHERYEVTI